MSESDRAAPARGPLARSEADAKSLREDLGKEYYAILDVVSDFDQRFITMKGWSVTLSLLALGVGFEEGHAAYFALAAFSGLSFWVLEVITKQHQLRYYSRMRDIEVACFHLNQVVLPELGVVSAPRIDSNWSFKGYPDSTVDVSGPEHADPETTPTRDWRTDAPWRRTPQEVHRLLARPWWMTHVLLPHALAVFAGIGLCLGVLLDLPVLGEIAW